MMHKWFGKFLFMVFITVLAVLVSFPESSNGQCGGGLFGGRARREARRAERVQAQAFGCAGQSVGYSQQAPARVVYVYTAQQAPTAKDCPVCPAPAATQAPQPATVPRYSLPLVPGKTEAEYPSAAFDAVPKHYVSMVMEDPLLNAMPENPGW